MLITQSKSFQNFLTFIVRLIKIIVAFTILLVKIIYKIWNKGTLDKQTNAKAELLHPPTKNPPLN